MKALAAGLFLSCLYAQTSAAIISSVARLDQGAEPWLHLAPAFNPHGPVWRDYSFIFESTPQYLRGADQILNSFHNDRTDSDFQLQVTLAQPAIVYLLIDDRVPNIAAEMPWVAALGFTDSGDQALVDQFQEPLLAPFSIYRATFPAGNVVLGAQNDSSPIELTGMYSAGAGPVPEPASGGLALVIAAAVMRRRPTSRRAPAETQ